MGLKFTFVAYLRFTIFLIIISNSLIINALPIPVIDLSPICSGQRLSLTNDADYTGPVVFYWSGPGGFTSNERNPIIRIEGLYSVYVDSVGNSTAPDTRTVSFYKTPALISPTSDTIKACEGIPAAALTYTALASNDTLLIYTDVLLKNLGLKTRNNPLFFDPPNDPGTYDYFLVRKDVDGCESQASELVYTRQARPIVKITPSDTFDCTVSQITLNAAGSSQGAQYSISWSGTSFVSGQTTYSPIIDKPGIYSLLITNTNTTCNRLGSVNIKAFVNPAVGTPKADVNICDTGLFDLYETLDSYTEGGSWMDPNTTGRITNGHFFNATGAASGTFTFTYKQDYINANCPGGTADCSFELIKYKSPGIAIPQTTCNAFDFFDLNTAISGNDPSGVWTSTLHAALIDGNKFLVKDQLEGNYVFTYKFQPASLCATDERNVTVKVSAVKSLGTGSEILICSDSIINLFNHVSSTERGGVWTDLSSTGKLQDSIFNTIGIKGASYSFNYSFPNNACPLIPVTVKITTDTIAPIIKCRAGTLNLQMPDVTSSNYEVSKNIHEDMVLFVSDNCDKYTLTNNINNDSTLLGASIPTTNKTITWTVRDNGMNVAECEVPVRFVYVPNIFTPNSDGFNDTWDFELGSSFSNAIVVLYDRWGTKVFESKPGYVEKWDGGTNSAATYRYLILLGEEIVLNGYVTLVR